MSLMAAFYAAPGFAAVDISDALRELIGVDLTVELLEQGKITQVQQKNPALVLAPRHDATRTLTEDILRTLDASLLAENLFLYRKPAGASAGFWSDAERTALYNAGLALSTLAGLQYFSTSRNAMRTFYETSTVIDGPGTRRPAADPAFAVPPPELTVYARQKDLTFGDNIYRYDYYAQPDALIFVQTNLTALNIGIIPAVAKEKIRSIVTIIDAGDYLLLYAASIAKAVSLPGMSRRIGDSFSTRAEAIIGWYVRQADMALTP